MLWIIVLILLVNLSTVVKVEASSHTIAKTGSESIDLVASGIDVNTETKTITLSVTLPSLRYFKYRIKVVYSLYVVAGGLGSWARAEVSGIDSISVEANGAVGDYDERSSTWVSNWFTAYGSSITIYVILYAEAKLGTADFNSYAEAIVEAEVTLEVEYPDLVTIEVVGQGSTSPSPGVYEVWGGSFSASASPATGWRFKEWKKDGVKYSTNPSINPSIVKDTVLTAVFEEQQPQKYRLVISVQGEGTTSPAPGAYYYVEGTSVAVSASPADGWEFKYWLLDGVKKTGNPITVVMDSDHMLVAVFEESGGGDSPPSNPPPPPQPKKYKLSIRVQGQGTTNPDPGDHYYVEGSKVTVKAAPSSGWRFKHWLLDGSVKLSNPITVVMD
ncbi:MAG: hypothetical protein DRJ52_09545, partial [Thermoprotei archaeon]